MSPMNQNCATIRLFDLVGKEDAWGREEGAEVYPKLLQGVQKLNGTGCVRISAAGLKRTDASFPRETVFAVALRHKGEKVFVICDMENESVADNWDMAGSKLGLGILCKDERGHASFLGPAPSEANQALYWAVVGSGEGMTAGEAARKLHKSLTNVSTQLKQLKDKGYLIRREIASPSGGTEFRYFGPK